MAEKSSSSVERAGSASHGGEGLQQAADETAWSWPPREGSSFATLLQKFPFNKKIRIQLSPDAAGLDDDESQEVLFTVMKEWEDGWSGVPGHEGVASSEDLFNHVCQILKEDGQVSTPAPPRMIMICPMLALAFPWAVFGRVFS